MKGNYIAVFIHAIWTTKYRLPVLPKKIRYPLFEHIRDCAEKKGFDLRIVNGVKDHVHCVFRLLPTQRYDKVVKDIKGESSRWLNVAFFDKPDWNGQLEKIANETPFPKAGEFNSPAFGNGVIGKGFKWQRGYGAISVSPQNVGKTVRYVFNQEQHHAKNTLDEREFWIAILLSR